jgi:hypothetical protein
MIIEAMATLHESNMCEHAQVNPNKTLKEKTKIMLPNLSYKGCESTPPSQAITARRVASSRSMMFLLRDFTPLVVFYRRIYLVFVHFRNSY